MGLYWWIYLKVLLWQLISLGAMFVTIIIYCIIVGTVVSANADLPYMTDPELNRYVFRLVIPGAAAVLAVTLLTSIPAVVARYRYCMAYYLMIENPNLAATDAVRCSIRLMDGHKWRLFCLNLSFIGWRLLSLFTLGLLGLLYVNPYQEFAVTAFYRDLVPAYPVSQMWNLPGSVPQPPEITGTA